MVCAGPKGSLQASVSLPLLSERQQNRGPVLVGHVHLTLVVRFCVCVDSGSVQHAVC